MNTLDEVFEYLGTVKDIHEGGCGIAALSIMRWLKKYHPEELPRFKVVFMYHQDEPKTQHRNMVSCILGNIDEITVPPHIGILWDGSVMEAGGLEVSENEYPLWHEVSLEILEETVKKYWQWNYQFSRFLNIPRIEKALGIFLGDMDVVQLQKSLDF
jgi:hypothetical protein